MIYVPWCPSVANVLEAMLARRRRPAAVVNELGETIGFLTFDDILDTIFSGAPAAANASCGGRRSGRLPRACGTSPA